MKLRTLSLATSSIIVFATPSFGATLGAPQVVNSLTDMANMGAGSQLTPQVVVNGILYQWYSLNLPAAFGQQHANCPGSAVAPGVTPGDPYIAAAGVATTSCWVRKNAALNLVNATNLPVSTGVSGLGTGVATALGVNVGSAGSFVVNGDAVTRVATMTSLRAMTAAKMGAANTVLLSRFYSDGPEIGEIFEWKSTTLTPNTFTVIKPSDASDCSSGCMVSKDLRSPTLFEFGAYGNGTTNDSAAASYACASLGALGGGTLISQKGVYPIADVYCNGSNIQYLGQGGAVWQLPAGTAAGHPILGVTHGTGVQNTGSSFRDMTFDGNASNVSYSAGASNLVTVTGTDGFRSANTTFQNAKAAGLIFTADSDVNTTNSEVYGINCNVTDVCSGLQYSGTKIVDGLNYYGGTAHDGTSEAFMVYPTTYAKNIGFHGTTAYNKTSLLIAKHVDGLTVEHSKFHDGGAFLHLCLVNEALCDETAYSGTLPINTNVVVIGNTSKTTGYDGIVGAAVNGVISGNSLTDVGRTGIWLETGTDHVAVTSNVISNVATAMTGYGIQLSSTNVVEIDANRFNVMTNASDGIRLDGTTAYTSISNMETCGATEAGYTGSSVTKTTLKNVTFCGRLDPNQYPYWNDNAADTRLLDIPLFAKPSATNLPSGTTTINLYPGTWGNAAYFTCASGVTITAVSPTTAALYGTLVYIRFADANCTINSGATVKLAGGTFTSSANAILVLQLDNAGIWQEVSRSKNS